MAKIVEMTQLSPTMSEGVLAKWLKKEGDQVGPGVVIAEVETDKANMELEAFDKGVLLKLIAKEGETVKVGAPIAVIGAAGEDVSAVLEKVKSTPAAKAPAAKAPEPAKAAKPEPVAAAAAPAAKAPARDGGRVFASPLAKAMAKDQGVDIASLTGSGPHGRIVKRDVESAASHPSAAAAFAPSGPDFEDKPLSQMRKTIAKRLEQAKRGVPHFYLTVEVDAAPLSAFRAQLNDGLKDEEKVSVNDLIVKAYALALAATPKANVWYLEDAAGAPSARFHRRVHVGVAVAIEDGLITPVVRDADKLPLSRLAATTKELIGRAKQKKLKPDEFSNGTGSVSNLGMMGIQEFSAILNPPESTIVAVGALEKRPVFDADGKVVAGERMKLTLSCDHRVVDGALGAELLSKVKKNLERPAKLAL